MSPLRRRMIEDMRLRNFSASTERNYVHYVAEFARHFNTSPENLGLDDIRNYQLYLTEKRQLSAPSINSFVSAVQFLYTVTLEMPWGSVRFVRMKRVPETSPVRPSCAEVIPPRSDMLWNSKTPRRADAAATARVMCISEAAPPKAGHIDSAPAC